MTAGTRKSQRNGVSNLKSTLDAERQLTSEGFLSFIALSQTAENAVLQRNVWCAQYCKHILLTCCTIIIAETMLRALHHQDN